MEMPEDVALPRELARVSLVADRDAVARYAELTQDFNPIHLNPEFAAGTSFGRPIAHGTLGLNLMIEALERTFGAVPGDAHLEVRFIAPVPVGAMICAGGHLKDEATGTYEIFVETASGERAIDGTCTIGLASEIRNIGASKT
ncbi:MaoC family dehydratase [Xanthobacter aminoxidans]|uniref:MaoC family dehydratase n=1 Tax=Xanthobacter aminoxidans TaxID=186280 RepID=UPI00372B018B